MTYTPKEGEDARTRDGQRVTELRWLSGTGFEYWEGVADGRAKSWHADGRHLAEFGNSLDLIGPWEDPAPLPKLLNSDPTAAQEVVGANSAQTGPDPNPFQAIVKKMRARAIVAARRAATAREKQHTLSYEGLSKRSEAFYEAIAIVERHMGERG